ncbi:hypothetical protein EVAR_49640_1 [Eumeta japonica]|uniref:Uncharacterized protein n=1 Tax=Eumeta variegata TaxID=151549 RepID=A0A4C1YCJ5_EUMVA|nr:hypothetical protein EVAR_49640_1 [Eumeta japonica]
MTGRDDVWRMLAPARALGKYSLPVARELSISYFGRFVKYLLFRLPNIEDFHLFESTLQRGHDAARAAPAHSDCAGSCASRPVAGIHIPASEVHAEVIGRKLTRTAAEFDETGFDIRFAHRYGIINLSRLSPRPPARAQRKLREPSSTAPF